MSADNSDGTAPVIGRPFPPGVSGNPAGRPKEYPEFKAACREHSDRALAVLVEALEATRPVYSDKGELVGEHPDHKLRVMAANALHDRAWGKPAQSMTGEDGKPIRLDFMTIMGALQKLAGDGQ